MFWGLAADALLGSVVRLTFCTVDVFLTSSGPTAVATPLSAASQHSVYSFILFFIFISMDFLSEINVDDDDDDDDD